MSSYSIFHRGVSKPLYRGGKIEHRDSEDVAGCQCRHQCRKCKQGNRRSHFVRTVHSHHPPAATEWSVLLTLFAANTLQRIVNGEANPQNCPFPLGFRHLQGENRGRSRGRSNNATALHSAHSCWHYSNVDATRMLLSQKASVNIATADDWATPLHGAAYDGCVEAAKLLLGNEADVYIYTVIHKNVAVYLWS